MTVLLSAAPGGSRVVKGDPVAEFDRQYMLNRIDDMKATVVQANNNVKKLMADLAVSKEAHEQTLRIARANVEKAKLDLKTIEVVSDIDAQRLKLAHEEADAQLNQVLKEVSLLDTSQRADLRATEIESNQTRLELERSQANAEKMVLKAPIDGIVVMSSLRRGMEMGQVQAGDQVYSGQIFMTIVDPSSMVLNASINQVDSEQLRIGMKARIRLDAYPGLELPAHVFAIGAVPVAGRRPNYMKQIPVRLKLDKMDNRIIPDLSASADIVLESAENAPMAPLSAIQQDGPSGAPFVWVESPQGWQKRTVELGVRSNLSVSIKSGLQPGDKVVVGTMPVAKSADPKSPSS
ncbi:MAG: efflux RND transporter periplasmic adaptor subunit [Bryobacteraceae bacterium]